MRASPTTGLMVTSVTDRHVCYAEPALVEAANLILRAKESGVRLRTGAAGPSGSAPDGSGVKSTVEVIAQVRSATSSGEVWADCGRMSREVQGVAGTDTPARGIYRDGAGTEHETSPGAPTHIRDEALVGAGLGTDAASARAAYDAMDPAARDAFDSAHGINRYAAPNVGESYMSVRNDALTRPASTSTGAASSWSPRRSRHLRELRQTGHGLRHAEQPLVLRHVRPADEGRADLARSLGGGPGREGIGVGAPGMGSMTVPTRTSADPSAWTPGTPA